MTHAIVNNALDYYGIRRTELDAFIDEQTKNDVKPTTNRAGVSQALLHVVRDWAVLA